MAQIEEMPRAMRRCLRRRLGEVPDFRSRLKAKRHVLADVLFIVVAAVCGMKGCRAVGMFAQAKEALLLRFIELPNRIPSCPTFHRTVNNCVPSEKQHGLIAKRLQEPR